MGRMIIINPNDKYLMSHKQQGQFCSIIEKKHNSNKKKRINKQTIYHNFIIYKQLCMQIDYTKSGTNNKKIKTNNSKHEIQVHKEKEFN